MKDKVNRICIERKKLPNNEQDALEKIFDYFNGFDIEYNVTESEYILSIQRSDFTYCEDMMPGFLDLGILPCNCDDYYVLTPNCCLCLSEAWIPYGWSIFLSGIKETLEKLTVIHIDDHADLMSPFIKKENTGYYDMITGKFVNFHDAETMYCSVISGSITIGSMLTPIVYSIKDVDVFHLRRKDSTEVMRMSRKTQVDDFMSEGNNRIMIEFSTVEGKIPSNCYIRTSDWNSIHNNIQEKSETILHIDMDYFNNRYNGSTSWQEDRRIHNPDLYEQKKAIDDVCKNIAIINKKNPIKYVLIGISPSFYPSEYWRDGLHYLLNGLENSGLDVGNLIDKIF